MNPRIRSLASLALAIMTFPSLASDPAPSAGSLPSGDRQRLEAGIARLGALTERPDLASSGYLAEIRAMVPLLDDPGVPAILRECLDHPFKAPEHADRIAAALLAADPLEKKIGFTASLLAEDAPPDLGIYFAISSEDIEALKALPEPLRAPITTYLSQAAYARRDALAEALRSEQPYWRAHVNAQQGRNKAARATDDAAAQYGPTLGWYTAGDNRVEARCKALAGRNFTVGRPPPEGYPGQVHGGTCRCHAGPPHSTDKTVYDVV